MAVEKIPKDIYTRCLATAKGYYALLQRRKDIKRDIIFQSYPSNGLPRSNAASDETARKAEHIIQRLAETERQIQAVEQAWSRCRNWQERDFIKRNLFEGIQMQFLDIEREKRTLKRWRKHFLIELAKNLKEI